jgi:hypothetical protein
MATARFRCGNDTFRVRPDGVDAVRNEGYEVIASFGSEEEALAWARGRVPVTSAPSEEEEEAWRLERQLAGSILRHHGRDFPAEWSYGGVGGPERLAFLAGKLFCGAAPTHTEFAGIIGLIPAEDEALFRELAAASGVRLYGRILGGGCVQYKWGPHVV